MSHKENHGQVGEALKIKMKLDTFNNYIKNTYFIEDKRELSIDELSVMGLSTTIPLIIDSETSGDYEVICEHGVEVRYFNDYD